MKVESVMSAVDSYIYRYRAGHTPIQNPPQVHLTQQQAEVLENWAANRKHSQDKVELNASGKLSKYRGIPCKVQGRS